MLLIILRAFLFGAVNLLAWWGLDSLLSETSDYTLVFSASMMGYVVGAIVERW
jgi:hypothetical protein